MRSGDRKRTIGQLRQREEQWSSVRASRRRTSAPPSFTRKRKCRDEAAAGPVQNIGHLLCQGCEIDGVHVECSFSTHVRGGKAFATYVNTSCLLCSETRLKTLSKRSIRLIVRSLKAYSPVVYDAAVHRITRWVPELKDDIERAVAKVKVQPCRGCEIDGVFVECSFCARVPGGKAMVRHPNTVCLLCSETRLKSHYGITLADRQDFRPQGTGRSSAGLFKIFYARREEHPAVYDAAMDRITRWVPGLKDHFERAGAKVKVQHKRAVADKQQSERQWASAKASRRSTSAPPSFVRKRKCQDEAPVRVTKSRGQG